MLKQINDTKRYSMQRERNALDGWTPVTILTFPSFGLMFFGTPHAGPTDDAKVKFGKICARVANMALGDPKNDLMQALEKNVLFSEVLQENWRHHLESYKIVSFYEGIGDVSSSLLDAA